MNKKRRRPRRANSKQITESSLQTVYSTIHIPNVVAIAHVCAFWMTFSDVAAAYYDYVMYYELSLVLSVSH